MIRCIASYSSILPLHIVTSESFTQDEFPAFQTAHFVDKHKEETLSRVQVSIHSLVAPQELLTVTSIYAACSIDDFFL
jgi:hypothetical protein